MRTTRKEKQEVEDEAGDDETSLTDAVLSQGCAVGRTQMPCADNNFLAFLFQPLPQEHIFSTLGDTDETNVHFVANVMPTPTSLDNGCSPLTWKANFNSSG